MCYNLARRTKPLRLTYLAGNGRASFFMPVITLPNTSEGKKEPVLESTRIPFLFLSCRIPPFYRNTNVSP